MCGGCWGVASRRPGDGARAPALRTCLSCCLPGKFQWPGHSQSGSHPLHPHFLMPPQTRGRSAPRPAPARPSSRTPAPRAAAPSSYSAPASNSYSAPAASTNGLR